MILTVQLRAFRSTISLLVLGAAHISCSTMNREMNRGEESLLKARGIPCGTVIGEIDGIKAYSNGPNSGTSRSCAGEGGRYGYLYQCKELVSRYFTVKYGAPRIACHAYQCYDAFKKYDREFEVFKNGSSTIPQRGDAIVFHGYTWGHVAIVTSVENGKINFLQQNMASPTGSMAIDKKGVAGSYAGFTTYGFIRHKKAPKGTQAIPATDLWVESGHDNKAADICATFGKYSGVNTCLKSVRGYDANSNILVDCQQKTFKTCASSCRGNTLGNHDSCEGEPADASKMKAISDDEAADVESEVFNSDLSADWVKTDLENLCSETLQVKGKAINTCRNNFKPGFLSGRFDDAKNTDNRVSKWLIDCTSAMQPRWVECRNGCSAAQYGQNDSCR